MFAPDPRGDDVLVAELWEQGIAGIVEESRGIRVFFDDDACFAAAASRYEDLVLETRTEAEAFWDAFDHEGWEPVLLGEGFVVAPSWVHSEPLPGRTRLTFDATNAFGTGRHESTQLMVEALEQLQPAGLTALDVGCGSGILSAVALHLGAKVFSCDVHCDAVTTAAAHIASPIFRGSVDAVRNQSADVVLANISARVVDELQADLNRVTRPGGWLVIGGFLTDAPPALFTPEKILQKDDWQCWVCRPQANASARSIQQDRLLSHNERWW